MKLLRIRWPVIGLTLMIIVGLWAGALPPHAFSNPCRTWLEQTQGDTSGLRSIPWSEPMLLVCAPLVAWTIQLVEAQLAQYPPGYGTPQLF